MVTNHAQFLIVDAKFVGHFIQYFTQSVAESEVADSCHHRVLDELVYNGTVHVVLDTLVLQ
jgi:hypothetical protein